ncbi:hypothetical protein MT325_m216L [Paramecium bursaria chlorella virus MT325]|uniref:Uncharacterized protein m216L n=1 Tax=Paramecium bursaria Chlorella virus MT325 TaxID=346932 RepID=A7ITU6_PBCVM|nr:hypothetical protein MT325_m216L [Paramecium bursaria chlorella virus MT325]
MYSRGIAYKSSTISRTFSSAFPSTWMCVFLRSSISSQKFCRAPLCLANHSRSRATLVISTYGSPPSVM